MSKPNALVKISSRLFESWEVHHYLRELEKQYVLRIIVGGGEQINAEFESRGWSNTFGPLGRICESFEQRLVASNVLEINAAQLDDRLEEAHVHAQTIVPVLNHEVGNVTCHVNGDLLPITCYNGYDALYVLTKEADVENKRRFYAAIWQLCRAHLEARTLSDTLVIDAGDLPPKLQVVGFA